MYGEQHLFFAWLRQSWATRSSSTAEMSLPMRSDIAIAVNNLAKTYRIFGHPGDRIKQALTFGRMKFHREFNALQNVSFEINKGEAIGIIGRNGSGKSTLLQLICGILKPTSGSVTVSGRISALLELGAGFNSEFTGRENVYFQSAVMGIPKSEMDTRFDDIAAFADIGAFIDQPVRTYSSGMFVRIAFATAIHVDPEILIVDEALSVGDSKFQHRCFQRIHNFIEQGKTVLIVSHNTDTLLRICHRGIVLDAGQLRHVGSISSAVNCYTELLYAPAGRIEIATKASSSSSVAVMPGTSVIGSLSEDVHDRIAEKPSYNAHETRIGYGSVKIIDFDLIVDGEVNPKEIRTHADVQLIFKILFNERLDDVCIGFSIETVDGAFIFGTNSEIMNMPFLSADAGKCIAVKLRWKSHLAGGEHFLSLGTHRYVDGEKCFLDVRYSVAHLKFANTPAANGFVDLELNHEIIELSEKPV
jgi:lipopolysaccharide transport system ATP-binding protein